MNRYWKICMIFLLIPAGIFIAGCIQDNEPVAGEFVSGEGAVRYQEHEGGFYGIITESGAAYNPLDLPPAFGKDGLLVTFTIEERPDIATTVMWGTAVSVVSIKSRNVTPVLIGGRGIITLVDLEGGFYGIVSPGDGITPARYYPLNLDDKFRVNRIHVMFDGSEQDMLTTSMWGIPLEVTWMERTES